MLSANAINEAAIANIPAALGNRVFSRGFFTQSLIAMVILFWSSIKGFCNISQLSTKKTPNSQSKLLERALCLRCQEEANKGVRYSQRRRRLKRDLKKAKNELILTAF
jgi:hypothetical protein